MSVTGSRPTSDAHDPTRTRFLAAGVAAGVAVLYVVLFLLLLPDLTETDNPAPVFLVLAVVYAVGAALLIWRDSRALHLVGVAVQVALLGGYLWLFAVSAANDEDEFFQDTIALGVAIAAAQVVLAVVLLLLARSSSAASRRAAAG